MIDYLGIKGSSVATVRQRWYGRVYCLIEGQYDEATDEIGIMTRNTKNVRLNKVFFSDLYHVLQHEVLHKVLFNLFDSYTTNAFDSDVMKGEGI